MARRQTCWNGGGASGLARAEREGRSARCGGAAGGMRRRVGALDGGFMWLLVLPVPEKMMGPAASCGQHRQRNASEEGRGARGERGEARGEFSHQFRTLEKATHLGGLQLTGRRLWRRAAACWVVRAVQGCSSVSREDDGASRRAFGCPEEDLVRPSSSCGG